MSLSPIVMSLVFSILVLNNSQGSVENQTKPSRLEVEQALRKAVEFYHWEVSSHGGYVWRYSSDLTYRRGEAVVGPTTIWVQPPGTPAVGEAMLGAFEATDDPYHLDAARDAAYALCKGQMHSGGWHYSIEFDPTKRPDFDYRENPGRTRRSGRSYRMTNLDDDTTQAATRLLVQVDQALDFEDPKIHDAATFALQSLLNHQHPNGGWYVWWLSFDEPLSTEDYPVFPAAFPDDWPRQWPNDWTGRYVTNDNLMSDMIETLLLADRVYGDPHYLQAAKRAGDFLILAQLPEPQPAWAQQYDLKMHPAWARKFEPPAISGGESQSILGALMTLYEATGEAKYLEPIPAAIAYFKRSTRSDGRLARFYELETNRPLYFTTDYQLTYQDDDLPTHYGFVIGSRIDRLEQRYLELREAGPRPVTPESSTALSFSTKLANEAQQVIDSLDPRGAWLGEASNGTPIIESATFVRNVSLLSRYLRSLAVSPHEAP